MKKHQKNTIVLVITGILLLCLVVISVSILYLNKQEPLEPIFSPSGGRVILASINDNQDDVTKYLCVKLVVQDVKTGDNLFEIQTGASSRMSWSVHWISENIIQLISSDIGIMCWVEGSDGIWQDWECPP